MAMMAEVVGVPGLFYVYYSSGPSKVGETIVYGLIWHLCECPFRVNPPLVKSEQLQGQQIHTWMPGAPCLYPAFSYALGDLPLTFLNS